jgi:hypothetical protein
VDLDEGPRIVSSWRDDILDCGLLPDARVKVVFHEIAPGVMLPRFAPEDRA